MKNRPYFQSSSAEIKAAVEQEKHNPEALKAIIKEIGYRKKTKASLSPYLAKSKEYLAQCNRQTPIPEASTATNTIFSPPPGIDVGRFLKDLILETFIDPETSRLRVRPIDEKLSSMRVEFPKGLREQYPVGTRFSATVKVSQKTKKADGSKAGRPYLFANKHSIKLVGGKINSGKGPKGGVHIHPAKASTPEPKAKPSKPGVTPKLVETEYDEPPEVDVPEIDNNRTEIIRGKPGAIRKPSNILKGIPQVWSPEPESTFTVQGLNGATTNASKYACALGGLIWEIRKTAKFAKTINLTNGKRQKNLSGEYGFLYSFFYEGDEEFFEGARIDFSNGNKKTKGSIVSIIPGKQRTILVSLEEDFGTSIKQCSITQDEAALLEALQKRFEIETGVADKKSGSPVGMNCNLADMLLRGDSEELDDSQYETANLEGLNNEQASFVNKAIKHSISVLWGPPGTGKTQSLGALIAYFYKMSERTLICSNTNQAVDQVLFKLCKELRKQGRMAELEDGKIVRAGHIVHDELSREFSEYITVDGISARKGAEITKAIKKLESSKARSEKLIQNNQKIVDLHNQLLNLEKLQKESESASLAIKNKINKNLKDKNNQTKKIEKLQHEKKTYESKGFFGRALSRGIESINADIQTVGYQSSALEKTLTTLTEELRRSEQNKPAITKQIKALKEPLHGIKIEDAQKVVDEEDNKISKINSKLTDLKKQIEDLRKTIYSQAIVLGTTLTKSFLSPAVFGKFHNVVIDEASMGLIPSVYFTATQSQRRCIISGDFRQLPPIVQSKNKEVLELVGGSDADIFKISGFETKFLSKDDCNYTETLKAQYRMNYKICNLISKIGYEGNLYTVKGYPKDKFKAPKLLSEPLIIIDTSSLYPFTDRDPFGSTSNVVHALIARNIIRKFNETENSGNLGYCAPFKAQTKLMQKMISDETYKDNVRIGTVHTFQGDEKNTMIFDTVNSIGEKHFINPALAQEHASKSNILTVAVSRAQNRLIFIANLRYLDTKIPAQGYLRNILYSAQTSGTVIDAQDIIDLVPLKQELEKSKVNIENLEISAKAVESGLVNEDTFFPLLKADLSKAKKYVAIYSGFYTANRVKDLLPILNKLVARGVKIRAILPPPDNNGSMDEADSEMVSEKLIQDGVLVDFRSRIHQKAVLIDENVAWFGSLNPMSFSGSTEESMLRVEQKGITGTFAANLAVNRNSAKDNPALMIEQEVPDCSYCGNKTVFHRGRYGPWVRCVKCKKTENLKNF